jgi:DNA-directed RNA polymerase subunit K/omega
MAKKKLTKAEREEMDARYERMLANARRTRELAEKAQAKLDAQRSLGTERD